MSSATATAAARGDISPRGAPAALVARCGVWGSMWLLLALCAFLFARRVAGGLVQTPSAGLLLALGLLAAVTACGWRLLGRRLDAPATRAARRLWLLLPSTAMVLLLLSLSLPAAPPWAVACLWFVGLTEEGAWWLATLLRRPPAAAADRPPPSPPRATAGDRHAAAGGNRAPPPAEGLPADVSQQLVRSRDSSGHDVVYGMLRGEFSAGQRSHNLHVAFCPPLEGTPQLTIGQLDGPAASIKVGQAESFGARFDVRLERPPRHQESIVLEFEARYAPAEVNG